MQRQFKFSGLVSPSDPLHQVTLDGSDHFIAAKTIPMHGQGIPQYANPIIGGIPSAFAPATDCGGAFMSAKFQPNNNCYAYGCNMATNTFAQPGRFSGHPIASLSGPDVIAAAESDGLINVGTTIASLLSYTNRVEGGHFVALFISQPYDGSAWSGDYHWARCDNSSGQCDSWSQKDGGDQVTNFDFAGNAISAPDAANWTVNQGPLSQGGPDMVVNYDFVTYMFVPVNGVTII